MPSAPQLLGALESAVVKGGHLLIRGWFAASDFSQIGGFRVSSAHVNLWNVSWKYGLPNRAARARVGVANCGFEVRVPIERAAESGIRDSLICVAPLVRGRETLRLFAIPKPSLPIPRKREWVLVGENFLPEACAGLSSLVNEAGLRRDESVLDIGCGLGRMAYVLSYYLLPSSRYEGLEPVRRWVRWNRAVLGARFRNFRFREFAVHNAVYNPKGRLKPASVRFPYPDGTFTLAFATSVFQHNPAAVVENYLGEIARVLRPGGRCLITCFLLDGKPRGDGAGKRPLAFVHPLKDCWTTNPDLPECGIAFLERDFRRWAADHDLAVQAKYNGSWRGRGWAKLHQDMVILRKR